MSELIDKLDESKVQRILEESFPKPSKKIDGEFYPPPSKPPEIETEGVFNQDYLEDPGAFIDNPMAAMLQPLIRYFESIKPPMASIERPKLEHKVRIYQLAKEYNLPAMEAFAAEIEALLNDGYCCHMPTVVGDYVIMDFSRRKESEEDGKQ